MRLDLRLEEDYIHFYCVVSMTPHVFSAGIKCTYEPTNLTRDCSTQAKIIVIYEKWIGTACTLALNPALRNQMFLLWRFFFQISTVWPRKVRGRETERAKCVTAIILQRTEQISATEYSYLLWFISLFVLVYLDTAHKRREPEVKLNSLFPWTAFQSKLGQRSESSRDCRSPSKVCQR